LALESGGTKLVAALTDGRGDVLEHLRSARPAANRAADTLRQLIEMGRGLRERWDGEGWQVEAMGFGFGGLVRRAGQEAYLCLHEAGWEQMDARRDLETAFGVPVFLENDCKVAALAEAKRGAGRGAESMFYATIGTGVGGGFVRGGRICELEDGGEAEIGHLCAEVGGALCGCGGRGCVEAICSGPGMWALGRHRFENTQAIFGAWERGDAEATEIVERCAGHMARALGAVMALLHPRRIVLGGGVASGNPRYVERIRELTEGMVVSYFRPEFDLRVAELGELVVSQGAALFALARMEERRSETCLVVN
jgi:glucokinase